MGCYSIVLSNTKTREYKHKIDGPYKAGVSKDRFVIQINAFPLTVRYPNLPPENNSGPDLNI